MAALNKHLLNDPKNLVVDSLKGLAYLNPHVELDEETRVVTLKDVKADRVHIICGGGSGHEPAHAAFVGDGMLSAAVCGNVFASPNSAQVTAGLQALSKGKGTLIVVKNYTGDVLHFGIAKEQWAAHHPEADHVKMVIVGDDVSVGKEQGGIVGRRGLAGTVLVYKLAGAYAGLGEPIDKVHALAEYVAERTATIAVGLEHCHVPGTDAGEGSGLKEDEMEVGMGIHNEPGFQRKAIPSVSSLVDDLLSTLTSTTDQDRSFLPFADHGGDSVILLVNNLGGLSELELSGVVKEAGLWLANKNLKVVRAVSGTFMTSLNMPGFSLSLVLLPSEKTKKGDLSISADLLIELLDADTEAPGWRKATKGEPNAEAVQPKKKDEKKKKQDQKGAAASQTEAGPAWEDSELVLRAIKKACKALAAAEPEITKYDTIAGDGDCGTTLKAGAEGVLGKVQEGDIKGEDAVQDLLVISDVVDHEMGGTSGGLYSIFFNALAVGVRQSAEKKGEKSAVTRQTWAKALEDALNTLFRYTRARPPSRTLVDPLSSFITNFSLDPSNLDGALDAAKEAAEATQYLEAKAGRAAYVDKEKVKGDQAPDAGAWGVWVLLEAIKQAIAQPKELDE